ncbi:MAG: DNA-binding protein [Oscillospiraceae bacterium]|nr:DNA-binding protein [Oscillospiraceae bacterium]
MAKNLELVLLLDCYGELLTDRQRDLAELYYNEDLSLSEIAQMRDITRQAVRDSLRHSESLLLSTEQKLGMAERIRAMRRCLEAIRQSCDNGQTGQIPELVQKGLELL